MVNIKTEFLREYTDQVISEEATDVFDTSVHLVRANSNKPQAPSSKLQAASFKPQAQFRMILRIILRKYYLT